MRRLLALLLLKLNQVVSLDRIVDMLWGTEPPKSARSIVQSYVSRLRGELAAADPSGSVRIVTHGASYRLLCDESLIDVHRFIGHATAGREALGRADPAQALNEFDAALGLWRGAAYADMCDAEWVVPEVARLEELRLSVIEMRCEVQLVMGEHHVVIAEMEMHVRAHPLREYGCELLALALYRAGRQAEALGVLRATRARLAEELGIDPGAALQRLERDVLDQAPILDWHSPRLTLDASGAGETAPPAPTASAATATTYR